MASNIKTRPSIRDVARACNVSPATVSNALSNNRYVRQETRERVLEAADRLGYRASTVARSLRLQRSWTIGLLVANIANPFYPEVVNGIEEVAANEGWNLFLCNTNHQLDKQAQYIELLLGRQVDGIILASHPDERTVEHLKRTAVPFVLLNKGHGHIDRDYVGIDHRGGIAKAFDHLWDLGHRRIAFIQGHPESDGANQRYDGFLECLRRKGLPHDQRLCVRGAYDFASGQAAGEQLLSLDDLPSAIIAASDTMALGAIDTLLKAGLAVPGDVSVVGFDDIPAASMPRIDLTTIRVPKKKIGVIAAQMLIDRIKESDEDGDGSERAEKQVICPVDLVVRNTTAAFRNGG